MIEHPSKSKKVEFSDFGWIFVGLLVWIELKKSNPIQSNNSIKFQQK
jgi:hypothetical protein